MAALTIDPVSQIRERGFFIVDGEVVEVFYRSI